MVRGFWFVRFWLLALLGGSRLGESRASRPAASLSPSAGPRRSRPPPAEPVSAIAARIEQQKDRARLVFETTAEVTPTVFPVADPWRIVVDLPEMAFRLDPEIGRPAKDKRGGDELVTSFRFGHFAPGRSRIVIDLARPAKIVRAESDSKLERRRASSSSSSPRTPASFAAEAARPRPCRRAQSRRRRPPPTPPGGKPMLVIDPGHGGVDVGAAGPHGEQEKTIVLEFARALKAKLEANGKLRVALTRNEDAFMALDERVRVARQAGAELFLSIHADTLAEPSVEGATVYTVSARASDAEAAKIAEKENFADRAAGLERKSEDAGEVGDILYDLTRRETRAYSHVFARTLIAYWQTVGHLNKNPSRSAGFVVLKTFDIPSVLLELGYLSSTRDLSRLALAGMARARRRGHGAGDRALFPGTPGTGAGTGGNSPADRAHAGRGRDRAPTIKHKNQDKDGRGERPIWVSVSTKNALNGTPTARRAPDLKQRVSSRIILHASARPVLRLPLRDRRHRVPDRRGGRGRHHLLFSKDLPDTAQLRNYEPPVMTRVHAGDGSLLAEYARERRLFMPIQAVPKMVKRPSSRPRTRTSTSTPASIPRASPAPCSILAPGRPPAGRLDHHPAGREELPASATSRPSSARSTRC